MTNIPLALKKPKPLYYSKNGKRHLYFPDFQINNQIYELKGYLTKEDKIKMANFSHVKILYKQDIENFKQTGVI